jgi:polyisoprenyl-teichoic acid--peptidoglycan teichoic acid transferase
MRISSLVLGVIGFGTLIVLTGICSLVTFSVAEQQTVELWDNGQRVESIMDVADGVLNPNANAFDVPTTATVEPFVDVAVSSLTPIPTIAPTQENGVASVTTQEPPTVQPTLAPNEPTPVPGAAEAASLGPRDINILLMGIDERVGYTTERAYRTDTMMVVHIDPVRKTAGVISFPRDLWVTVPGYQESVRLNTANYIGDLNAYPNGAGPGLAMETFNTNFGIRVDYYIMVNFTVFESLVDIIAPEGVEVCVTESIRDDHYPDVGFGTMLVTFEPGCQQLDGERLLQYARTRATENSDLDRARRQQQTIEALRNHVLSAGGIQAFLTSIPSLWDELSGSYRTNLTIQQIIGLGYLMNEIPRDNIRYQVIGIGYVQPGETPDKTQQILIPIHSRIQELIAETFFPEVGETTTADLQALAAAEDTIVRVFNGTQVQGLAGRTQEYLTGLGVRVSDVGNVTTPTNQPTMILDYGGGRDTARWIADMLGLPPDRVQIGTDGLATSGVIVIAGPDMEDIMSGE